MVIMHAITRRFSEVVALIAALVPAVVILSVFLAAGPTHAQTVFTVVSTVDARDDVPGDKICKSPDLFLPPPLNPLLGSCTLRAAIQEANATPGTDTIILGLGTYRLEIGDSGDDTAAVGDLDITDDLVITGAGPAAIVGPGPAASAVEGIGTDRIFHIIGARVELSGMTVKNGAADTRGGGIRVTGSTSNLTLSEVVLLQNRTFEGGGGGIWNDGGQVSLVGSSVVANSAFGGGGIGQDGGSLNLQDTLVSGNVSVAGDPVSGVRRDCLPCGVCNDSWRRNPQEQRALSREWRWRLEYGNSYRD